MRARSAARSTNWCSPGRASKIDKVAGIEARGFILGGAVAHQVSAGFVPIRKKGKLPHKRVSIAYSLEYGLDEMEMHEDAVEKGDRVILVDDLIATGGTAEGAVKLLRQLGARGAGGLLRHRPARARRRRQAAQARRAGAHADLLRGPLRGYDPRNRGARNPCRRYRLQLHPRQRRAQLLQQQPQLELAELEERAPRP